MVLSFCYKSIFYNSATWENVVFLERNNGYNTLQFYTCDISPMQYGNSFVGGLQDNGTLVSGILNDLDEQEIDERIKKLFEKLALTEYANKRCSKLSRGNKQKVAIARAIIHEPPVFIFDEPTSGLDVLSSRAVLDFTKQCEAEEICDRIGIIHNGKILKTGNVKELVREYGKLENVFISSVRGEKS